MISCVVVFDGHGRVTRVFWTIQTSSCSGSAWI